MRESRRDFLRRTPRRIALVSAVTQSLLTSGCSTMPKVDKNYQLGEVVQAAGEGAAFGTVNLLFTNVANRLGLKLGNAGMVDLYEAGAQLNSGARPINWQSEAIMDVLTTLVIPPMEEYAFRAWPSHYFLGDTKDGIRWDVGTPACIGFAFFHNISPIRLLQGRFPIALDRLPVQQFVGGMVYWKKFRETNLVTASVMHGVVNGFPSIPLRIASRIMKSSTQ